MQNNPTRTSIQYGMTLTALGKFATVAPKTLPPTSDAMASRLKAAFPQYKAAHFGKWHQRSRTPEDIGYESKRDRLLPVAKRDFYKSYPLRSHKYVISEGGIRVPFIVSGPGIPAGVSSKVPVVGWDFFSTVLDMVGASEHTPNAVEGGSLLPLCSSGGKAKVVRLDPFMVFRSALAKEEEVFGGVLDVAIIQGGYKLYRELESGNEYLWSLNDDFGESRNLMTEIPERAEQLRRNMDAYCERVGWDQKERAAPPKNRG